MPRSAATAAYPWRIRFAIGSSIHALSLQTRTTACGERLTARRTKAAVHEDMRTPPDCPACAGAG